MPTGFDALPCDDTLGLYCYTNYTCQCSNTMYWDVNDQLCKLYETNFVFPFVFFSSMFIETKRLMKH